MILTQASLRVVITIVCREKGRAPGPASWETGCLGLPMLQRVEPTSGYHEMRKI